MTKLEIPRKPALKKGSTRQCTVSHGGQMKPGYSTKITDETRFSTGPGI